LYQQYHSAVAAQWFSHFFEKAFVSLVKRRPDMESEQGETAPSHADSQQLLSNSPPIFNLLQPRALQAAPHPQYPRIGTIAMATEKQLAANRTNARKSTGPRTGVGKTAAALNSLKHGLTARQALLPGEDRRAFADLVQSVLDRYQPADPQEQILTARIVYALWRLRRLPTIETEMLAENIQTLATGSWRVGKRRYEFGRAFMDTTRGFTAFTRYEMMLDRMLRNSRNQLEMLQQNRLHPPPEPPAELGSFCQILPRSEPPQCSPSAGLLDNTPGRQESADSDPGVTTVP